MELYEVNFGESETLMLFLMFNKLNVNFFEFKFYIKRSVNPNLMRNFKFFELNFIIEVVVVMMRPNR